MRHALLALACIIGLVSCSAHADSTAAPELTAGLSWAYPRGETTVFGAPIGPGPFRMEGSILDRTEVVETDTVPRTIPDKFGWLNPAPDSGTEAIAGRIIELSDNMSLMQMGNDRVRVVDYVPRGALARGKHVVETGGGGGQPCATCHGTHYEGATLAPPLSGRSAIYLARTLWDIRSGARRGDAVALMQIPARGLTPEEIRDAAAYLASLNP